MHSKNHMKITKYSEWLEVDTKAFTNIFFSLVNHLINTKYLQDIEENYPNPIGKYNIILPI